MNKTVIVIIIAAIVVILIVFLMKKKQSAQLPAEQSTTVDEIIASPALTSAQRNAAIKAAKTSCLKLNAIPFVGQFKYLECLKQVKVDYA